MKQLKPLYRFWGKVHTGNKRGRDLGFPTINMRLHHQIPEGIYLSLARVKGIVHPALTFIGPAKTYNERLYQAETYILNFQENLYGQYVSVSLLKKIRGNKKFASEAELVTQMHKDKQEAEAFFTKLSETAY